MKDATSCRICGGVSAHTYVAHEMMLGLGTGHPYDQCGACGTLQLADVPSDLSRYYDPDLYYSLADRVFEPKRGRLRAWIGNRGDLAHIFDEHGIFGMLARARRNPVAERLKSFVGESPVRSWNAAILDVGCGSGALARELADHGFRYVEGIDPFMPDHHVSPETIPKLRRAAATDLVSESQRFDLVMLTHVLEHVPDPIATLQAVASLLSPAGVCRIEVPVTDCDAHDEYGACWVELDAPRHLHIPSRRAIVLLAARAGLEIYRSHPAGSGFEFWGSEMYRRELTLVDPQRRTYRAPQDLFSDEELRAFEARAARAAARGRSGRERFYLRRP